MSDAAAVESSGQPMPFVVETLTSKALHFSHGAIQSRMRLDDPNALDLDYTRLMMGFLLFIPKPKHLVMIGLGGGSLPKFCHRHLPRSRIDVVEINPRVIALRDQFHIPSDSARFRVVQADGARFVREQASPVDVLIVDGFDDLGQPPQLASCRFYDDCRDSLAEDGVMVVNLHSEREYSLRCVQRIRRSFRGQLLLVDSVDDCNMIAFAFKSAGPFSRRPAARSRPAQLRGHAAKSLQSAIASVERALQDLKTARSTFPIDSNQQVAPE
jgi:spermidine synthase